MKRKKEQEMSSGQLMKDEHFGAWILQRDHFRPCQSIIVCFRFLTGSIVIKIVSITVDNTYDRVRHSERTLLCLSSCMLNRKVSAARRQQHTERQTINAHQKHRVWSAHKK